MERKEGGARGGGRKEARELESIRMRAGAGHPVIFGNSLVECGRKIE